MGRIVLDGDIAERRPVAWREFLSFLRPLPGLRFSRPDDVPSSPGGGSSGISLLRATNEWSCRTGGPTAIFPGIVLVGLKPAPAVECCREGSGLGPTASPARIGCLV